ncbi:MAG: type II toxin-antitoxin system PemK/MazF family toxin [Colwellia sp.]|jgi:Uncharacterized protein conserved in bacteria
MAITYTPKVGDILECDFGNLQEGKPYDFDKRVPYEMVKNRMVVIINPKLNGNCLVVPISSKKNLDSINRKMHIDLPQKFFRVTSFYDKRERWAKCETIQLVSKERLFKMRDGAMRFEQSLDRETVTLIQKAICKSINAQSLLA